MAKRNVVYSVLFEGVNEAELEFSQIVKLAKELKTELKDIKFNSNSLKAFEKQISSASQGALSLQEALEKVEAVVNRLNLKLSSGAGQLNASFGQAAEIDRLRESLKKTTDELSKIKASLQGSAAPLKSTVSALQRLEEAYKKAQDQAARGELGNFDVIKNLRAQLKLLTNELLLLGSIDGTPPDQLKTLNTQIESVRQSLDQAQQVSRRGLFEEGSLQDLRIQLRAIDRELDNVRANGDAFNNLTQQAAKLRVQLREAEIQSGRFQRNIGNYNSVGTRVVNTFRRIGAAVLAAFAVEEVIFRTRDAIEQVLRTTVEFSGEITKAVSLAQETVRDLDDIGNSFGLNFQEPTDQAAALGAQLDQASLKARQFAAVSNFTAQETGKSFTQLGRSGFSLGQIFEITPQVQQFALAVGEELPKATDTVISALRTFNSEQEISQNGLKLSADAVNIFTATLNGSNINLEEFDEAFKQIAPTAAAFKVDIAEVSNIIGELGDRNLRGTLATTSLKTSFTRLLSDIPAVKKEMARLNVTFADADGNFVGMNESIRILEDAYKTFTPEAKAASLSVLVGNRAFNQFNVLLGVGADNLDKGTASLRGVTANVDDLTNALDNLDVSTLSDLGISVQIDTAGNIDVRQLVSDVQNAFDGLDEQTQIDLAGNIFGDSNAELIVDVLSEGESAAAGLGESLDRAARSGKSLSQEIADIQLESLENQTKLLESAMQELALTVGNILEEPFRDVLSQARLFATALAQVLQGVDDVSLDPILASAFSGDELGQINSFISGINSFKDTIATLIDAFKILGPLVAAYRLNILQGKEGTLLAAEASNTLTASQRRQLSLLRVLNRVNRLAWAPINALTGAARSLGSAWAQSSGTGNIFQRTVTTIGISARGAVGGLSKLATTVKTSVVSSFRTFTKVLLANPIFFVISAVQLLISIFGQLAQRTDATGQKFRAFLDTAGAISNFLLTVFIDAIAAAVEAMVGIFNYMTFQFEAAEQNFSNMRNSFAGTAKAFNNISTARFTKEIDRAQTAINNFSDTQFSIDKIAQKLQKEITDVGIDVSKASEEELINAVQGTVGRIQEEFETQFSAQSDKITENAASIYNDAITELEADLKSVEIRTDPVAFEEAQTELKTLRQEQLELSNRTKQAYIDENREVEANIRLALQQIKTREQINDLGTVTPPPTPTGSGEDAIKSLELEADRILQRLESVGDRANERLEAAFLKDLFVREEFLALSMERRLAIMQDGLNTINDARNKARQLDIDSEKSYLDQQLDLLTANSETRLISRSQAYAVESLELQESLDSQLITQNEYNTRFKELQAEFYDDLGDIRDDRLVDRFAIIAGDNSEILDRLPALRVQLEEQRKLRNEAAQDQLSDLEKQQQLIQDALDSTIQTRFDLENQYTENLVSIEEGRTAALAQAATQAQLGNTAQVISDSFTARIDALTDAYNREEKLISDRSSFLDLEVTKLNLERNELEANQTKQLAALLDEREEVIRNLRSSGASVDLINATIARFDERERILQDGYADQISIVESQGGVLTEAITQAERSQIEALRRFNSQRLELQSGLNSALTTALSTSDVDVSDLASQFVTRTQVIDDGFAAEAQRLEANATTQLALLQRIQVNRVAKEKSLTADLKALASERKQAIASFDIQTDGIDAYNSLIEDFDQREDILRSAFSADLNVIRTAATQAESALGDAYNARQKLDRDYYAGILSQQKTFVSELGNLQDLSQSLLGEDVQDQLRGISAEYTALLSNAKTDLDTVLDNELSSFADRILARTDFIKEIKTLVAEESATLGDLGLALNIDNSISSIEDLFTVRQTTLEAVYANEQQIITAQNAQVDRLLINASTLRDNTEIAFQSQITKAQALREEVETLSSSVLTNLDPGPSNEDIPAPLSDAALETLTRLTEQRLQIIENGRTAELDLLARRETTLLTLSQQIEQRAEDSSQAFIANLAENAQTQAELLTSGLGLDLDLTQLNASLTERQDTLSQTFEAERNLIDDQIEEVTESLNKVLDAQLLVNSELNAKLLTLNESFQKEFAQAFASGASQTVLDNLELEFAEQAKTIESSYEIRKDLLVRQEENYLDLLNSFSAERGELEVGFFTRSAQNFERGTQLLREAVLSSNANLVSDLTLDTSFFDATTVLDDQLSQVNRAIREAQVERLSLQEGYIEELSKLQDKEAQSLRVAPSERDRETIRVQFSRQRDQLISTYGQLEQDVDLAIRNLETKRSSLADQQLVLLDDFNKTIIDQNNILVRELASSLTGADLFAALTQSIEVETQRIEAAYQAQNEAIQTKLDERLAAQQRIAEDERALAASRLANLDNQTLLEQSLLQRIAQDDSVVLPEGTDLEIGNLIRLVGEIEGLDQYANQLNQVQDIGAGLVDKFDELQQASRLTSLENRDAIQGLRNEQITAYNDYLTSVEQVVNRREGVFAELVEEGVIPERVAQIQQEADALKVFQAEVLKLESERNAATLEQNEEQLREIEGQLAIVRDRLALSTAQLNGEILAEIANDYQSTVEFLGQLSAELVARVNEQRDASFLAAEGNLRASFSQIDGSLLADDIFVPLVEGAERAGAGILESVDLSQFELTADELNGLKQSLDQYREATRAANAAQVKGQQDAQKQVQKTLTEIQKLRLAEIDRAATTAVLDEEAKLASQLNSLQNEALAQTRRNVADKESIENERRARELILEREHQRKLLLIERERLEARSAQTNLTIDEQIELNEKLQDIATALDEGDLTFLEDLSSIAQDLTVRELETLRASLKDLLTVVDDPAVQAIIKDALATLDDNVINTFENIADQAKQIEAIIKQASGAINDALNVDEIISSTEQRIDDLIKKQEALDDTYEAQIENLQKLAGVQEDGLTVADARNIAQRLTAFGVQEALEKEAEAVEARYLAEKDYLDRELEEEKARNLEYQNIAKTLSIAESAAAFAVAAANSVAAVVKFSNTTAALGPAAIPLIASFVATMASGIALVKSATKQATAEYGGLASRFETTIIYGGPDQMREGGLRRSTLANRQLPKTPRRVKRVKRGVPLVGNYHTRGGILTELEKNEYVSPIPTVEMFLPQLDWMTDQGNRKRDGRSYSTEFPTDLFPSSPTNKVTSPPAAPYIPKRITQGYAETGGLASSGLSTASNELLEEMVVMLSEGNSLLMQLQGKINKRPVLVLKDLNEVQDNQTLINVTEQA